MGLGASVLFAPGLARVWAQSEGAVKLLQLPKIALVIGNSRYKDSPLKNPANDAKAIAAALKSVGFGVNVLLDAPRSTLASAVDAYVKELAAKKCVGLFYYAGHGIQLAWKNYMLPVDMEIDSITDVQKQGVEVHSLMEGLTKAANALNVVILDACRDNPFGSLKGADQKGLSQMDAPNQTLLAYATAPGNVASDGEGANGLYTESFLREMKVPEAKLEDVFKRVRLAVRRRSNGAQVPWESTSLEEDFWFIPPKELKARSETELETVFAEELAVWEKAKESKVPAPLEDYLRRYPSGKFAELAQLQLDRVLAAQGEKRVEIASVAGNPYSQGSARANTAFKVGDTYIYREMDQLKNVENKLVGSVSEIRENEVVFSGGLITDLLGNIVQRPDGRRFTPRQDFPLEYAVGRRWSTRTMAQYASGINVALEFQFRITKKEKVTVPAGTFDCFVIEGLAQGLTDKGIRTESRLVRWMAPDLVRRPIIQESGVKVIVDRKPPAAAAFAKKPPPNLPPIERITESLRMELVGFKQS
jgi:hypothetical protein